MSRRYADNVLRRPARARWPSTTGTPRPRAAASSVDAGITRAGVEGCRRARRRSTSSSPITVLASWISPRTTISTASASGMPQHLHVRLLRTVQVAVRPASGRSPGTGAGPSRSCRPTGRSAVRYSSRPADSPTSSISSRAAVTSVARPRRRACRPGSPARSGRAGRGTGGRTPPSACRRSNSSGTTPTAPGERMTSRSNISPSGASKVATATCQMYPWCTSRSPRCRNPMRRRSRHRRHATDELASSTTNRCGAARFAAGQRGVRPARGTAGADGRDGS